ncbi:NADP-dependent 3-hydroxy acid dehydrogenase YdfG [Mucilaginibacter frigoritolerans]|uniref:NADP-dependent 3-hydroxy acid dehydrogenase YdfG n=1 Tax=Mucilaginibacter frigoritolerans TaxID=652788 RepID=A0A562TMZ3_9SPHI|nr:oxidoreductase [Mucilaginibacter frigoritolerans]TWI94763.1 NADP-dependent 3-hydroxy acid dehydrogenase YdfG [Mucilaginibacter frigoritolerans]
MKSTKNTVWFITGASSGFGKAFAEYAIGKGYQVVVTARRTDKLDEIKALAPSQVEAIKMDVNNNDEVNAAVQQAIARFGGIDVLINNAGYGILGAVEETPEEELRAQLETNFFGAVKVTRALLPLFRQQQHGAIVNISSMGGQMSFAGFGAYSASKFALEGLSEALASELKPFNIKVLIVEPGAFRTDLMGSAMKKMPVIEAYKDTVGGTRAFAETVHHNQEGDPLKAARAIDTALKSAHTPLRLVLGADALQAIKAHAETLLGELNTWESVSVDTVID